MEAIKAKNEYRISQWAEIISEKQRSGLRVIEYCEKKGIGRDQYYYWQRKVREAITEQIGTVTQNRSTGMQKWAVVSTAPETTATLEIEVGGCRISVNEKTDEKLLARTVQVLRAI